MLTITSCAAAPGQHVFSACSAAASCELVVATGESIRRLLGGLAAGF